MQTAVRYDEDLKRFYQRLAARHGRPKAKIATARKLLIRAYIMMRDEIDYAEFRRRAVAVRRARPGHRPNVPDVLIGQPTLSRLLAGAAARLAELVRARSAGSYGESELNLMDDDRIDD
jgi:hypothetical protein